MTATETIFQCANCLRYFVAAAAGEVVRSLAVVALSIGEQASAAMNGRITPLAACGLEDCADLVAARKQREHEHLQRFQRSQRDRPVQPRKSCEPPTVRPARIARLPYAEEPEPQVEVPALMRPGARQENFIASGATAKTDARVRDFLVAPQNFGKWFSRKFLKEIARNDLLNNIADRLRDELIPAGLYVDNCMMSEAELGAKSSHYRVCRIEDALSLSAEEKLKLTTKV